MQICQITIVRTVFLAAVTLTAMAIHAATPTQVEGLDVSLTPPPGFTQAQAFDGFQHIQSFASIEIRELEAPFLQVSAQLTADIFTTKDIELLSKQELTMGGRDAVLLQLAPGASRPAFDQWVLVIGDRFRSVSITASYPRLAAAELSPPLKQSLLTTRWLRTEQQQLLHDLPFTASETTDLKYARRTGNMLVLADTSSNTSLGPLSPSIVIGHLSSETELIDIKAISHRQLRELSSLEITGITEEGETKVDGIRAYKIVAQAKPRGGEEPLILTQVMAFQLHKSLLVQSSVEASLAPRYTPQFETVLESITFKPAK